MITFSNSIINESNDQKKEFCPQSKNFETKGRGENYYFSKL